MNAEITPTAPDGALRGSMRDFRELAGVDLLDRVRPFFDWQQLRQAHGLWPYSKATDAAPQPVCSAKDEAGREFGGVNFASQDYLGLASHPEVKSAAREAIEAYGVHSAGSSALAGNTRYSVQLEHAIAEFVRLDHVTLYPTGWAAGYGVMRGLVREADHIVIDALAHACLQEGAAAATRNVHPHRHIDLDSVRRRLKRIRDRDSDNAILVVTESLFSMDSYTPDLRALQALCREYKATLLVDVAHDLGCLGPDGGGHLAAQGMTGKIDLVMGSFSKTFASNGGFIASNSPAVRQYLKFYGSAATFSNALSPVQCAVVLKVFDILRSAEGQARRDTLLDRAIYLRGRLQAAGFGVIGDPSAIVPALVGPEDLARRVSRLLPALGVVANLVEYPAVAKGSARFRLQVMATHSRRNVEDVVVRLRQAVDACTPAPAPIAETHAAAREPALA
ncbi:MAG TPA: aminotransferase class I/II-fold pyridoxal phosphate-dependent enzyme [Acidisphaera sp.]|nr:aminotransferase class I/II-fold pyridoxal phosphate-dependent enzyme [Acidisphaera sp.]